MYGRMLGSGTEELNISTDQPRSNKTEWNNNVESSLRCFTLYRFPRACVCGFLGCRCHTVRVLLLPWWRRSLAIRFLYHFYSAIHVCVQVWMWVFSLLAVSPLWFHVRVCGQHLCMHELHLCATENTTKRLSYLHLLFTAVYGLIERWVNKTQMKYLQFTIYLRKQQQTTEWK